MQSVPITTNVVNSNAAHSEVYSIQQYVIRFVSDLRQVAVVSSTNNDVTEILLEGFNHHNPLFFSFYYQWTKIFLHSRLLNFQFLISRVEILVAE